MPSELPGGRPSLAQTQGTSTVGTPATGTSPLSHITDLTAQLTSTSQKLYWYDLIPWIKIANCSQWQLHNQNTCKHVTHHIIWRQDPQDHSIYYVSHWLPHGKRISLILFRQACNYIWRETPFHCWTTDKRIRTLTSLPKGIYDWPSKSDHRNHRCHESTNLHLSTD